jgi:exopolysaccharide biosynthesis protein
MALNKIKRLLKIVKNKIIYRKHRLVYILLFIIMSTIVICAGHFLFIPSHKASEPKKAADGSAAEPTVTQEEIKPDPVRYQHRSEIINGLKQEIDILEIDLSHGLAQIKPVLSHDLIYGFQLLSEMAENKDAYAAVNAGFFHAYGLPSGMVMIDGELILPSTGNYPVFIIENGAASLKNINSEIIVKYGSGNENMIKADAMNFPAEDSKIAVYTPVYGKTNRAEKSNITATVVNGTVTRTAFYYGEAEIPSDGMLITFFDTDRYEKTGIPIKEGDPVTLTHLPDISNITEAYECGCWLVRDGDAVAPERDAWVGVLTNHDPRTAVGIKDDGTVILMTVDGRQPGYSAGFTGRELADYLIGLGAKDAAMLDGGASTEMIVRGRMVNRPSFKGEERPLAGALVVITGDKDPAGR